MSVMAQHIARNLDALDAVSFPQSVVCSHFGHSFRHANLYIQISPRGFGTLVTMYDRRVIEKGHFRAGRTAESGGFWVGHPSCLHSARANSLARATKAKIRETWNGNDGSNGISVVLDRTCPKVVLTGVQNYRDMPSPFDLRDSDKAGFAAYRKATQHIN